MKAKKRISITLMIFPFLIAALLLSGCSPASSLDENTIADAADSAAEAAIAWLILQNKLPTLQRF